jgi:hypothetical protein
MAQLRTDYKDEILDVSVNTQRKYRQVDNGDGTISFVDATVYSQQGDPFGAGDINAITGNLTADNGESFNFGYNSEKKEYGFWAKVEGADTFFPFSNAKKLYEALQYSGLVTEDMTFDEMLAVLAEYFPEIYKLYMSSANEGGFTAYAGVLANISWLTIQNPSVSFGDTMTVGITNAYGSVVSDLVDLTRWKKLKFHHKTTSTAAADGCTATVFITKSKTSHMGSTTVKSKLYYLNVTSLEEDIEIDISGLSGKHYICFEVVAANSSWSTSTAISNVYLE